MANKFIIVGAANNGDGTASNEAASPGAAGAWNSLDGTYGVFHGAAPQYGTAIAAGDTIYIRCKTSAGANITITITANVWLGSAAPSQNAPVKWVLDNGTMWPGVTGGELRYFRNTNITATLRAYNIYHAEREDGLVFEEGFNGSNTTLVTNVGGTTVSNVWFDCDNIGWSGVQGPRVFNCANVTSVESTLINPRFDMGLRFAVGVLDTGETGTMTVINPRINLGAVWGSPVFAPAYRGGSILVYGGVIKGAGAEAGAPLYNGIGSDIGVTLIGTKFPILMKPSIPGSTVGAAPRFEALGCDGGLGAYIVQRAGSNDSRTDGFYPTLNATFPDGASTPWAWKCYPANASFVNYFAVPIAKVFTDTAATKKVTVEIQRATDFTEMTAGTCWLEILYIKSSDGAPARESTFNPGATGGLATSSAAWTLTTWGEIGLTKEKLEVTTQHAIKQNTNVVVTMFCAARSQNAQDVFFLCPDVQLSTP